MYVYSAASLSGQLDLGSQLGSLLRSALTLAESLIQSSKLLLMGEIGKRSIALVCSTNPAMLAGLVSTRELHDLFTVQTLRGGGLETLHQ